MMTTERRIIVISGICLSVVLADAAWIEMRPDWYHVKAFCGILSPTERELYQAARVRVDPTLNRVEIYAESDTDGGASKVREKATELRIWAQSLDGETKAAFTAAIDDQESDMLRVARQVRASRLLADKDASEREKRRRILELADCLPEPPGGGSTTTVFQSSSSTTYYTTDITQGAIGSSAGYVAVCTAEGKSWPARVEGNSTSCRIEDAPR